MAGRLPAPEPALAGLDQLRQRPNLVAVDAAEPVHRNAHPPLRFLALPGVVTGVIGPAGPHREAQEPVRLIMIIGHGSAPRVVTVDSEDTCAVGQDLELALSRSGRRPLR